MGRLVKPVDVRNNIPGSIEYYFEINHTFALVHNHATLQRDT